MHLLAAVNGLVDLGTHDEMSKKTPLVSGADCMV